MKRINNLWEEAGIRMPIPLDFCPFQLKRENKVNILALGDVGMTVLLGLRLLGGENISQLGICDLNKENVRRLEQEMNQINYPFGMRQLPPVKIVEEEELFDCDVMIFCASKGVPPLSEKGDVRMAQLEANREIVAHFGALAKEADYKGMIAVVSDPVDPLCNAFLKASGLHPAQIQGFGLGVMNTRALYFAERDTRFSSYIDQGRAFGPHGQDLVIANSLEKYDEGLSQELTKLTTEANLRVRELGYKPYIAPALSSAAISILLTLQGQWHYSSLYIGDERDGAFLGIKNQMTGEGPVYEELELPEELYVRIQHAYDNLRKLK